jgi:hypothetical protein
MAKRLSRRRLLEILAGLPFVSGLAQSASAATTQPKTRVRPGDEGWPSEESWDQLGREVEGRLIKVRPPLPGCARSRTNTIRPASSSSITASAAKAGARME